ncbi:pheromone-regulated membrane protein 10-like [Teratosphaeria destructans]|uniref:Pheromone-regulated membrane protein 10-like n=1 Tax=Teratosphaeria destructans TaxID=418781 RepID=A0A9W7SPI2_9PEZI|nr:pheromone-regulated membrane protein 10-like [Teratosphaeria destructans]
MSTPVEELANPFGDATTMENASPASVQEPESLGSSAGQSQPGSAGAKRLEKKRVGFREAVDPKDRNANVHNVSQLTGTKSSERNLSPPRIGVTPPWGSPRASGSSSPNHSRPGSRDFMLPHDHSDRSAPRSHLPELSPQQTQQIHAALNQSLPNVSVPGSRPRPAIRRTLSNQNDGPEFVDIEGPDDDGQRAIRQARAREAYERGKRLETDERARSESNSRYTSPERRVTSQSKNRFRHGTELEIPLENLSNLDGVDYDSDVELSKVNRPRKQSTVEAQKLVRQHTVHQRLSSLQSEDNSPTGQRSGAMTPLEDQAFYEDYREQAKEYRGGILGSLLKLYGQQQHHINKRYSRGGDWSTGTTPTHSPPESGASTPTWFGAKKHKNQSTSSLARLIGSSASLGSPALSGLGEQVSQRLKEQQAEDEKKKRPKHMRAHSSSAMAAFNRISKPLKEEKIRITLHIAETIQRQKYLMKLCRALMLYGAPTHRLEEYMNMSARVLEIQAQFLYIPGSMIMSFDDPDTHTTEVKLVRVTQGLDLGKLRDTHEVYKEVVHDRIGVEEATQRLHEITKKKPKHSRLLRIPVYGLAAAFVGPFAFGSRLIDLPIAFLLGCILGVLQLVIAPHSELYANVFEISATVITSFLSRAFGSIPDGKGGHIFCFAALAQSSIALILPGYIVLCASLELQSRSIVAGSIRMVYAIIYSLFLGFGITIGSAIYGIMDTNAVSATTCGKQMEYPYFFAFVPAFAMCLIIINQAKWRQAPIMLLIAFVGYLVNYYSAKRFEGNTQVSNALAALAIGVMANLYSRIGARIENWLLDFYEDRARIYWKGIKRKARNIGKKEPGHGSKLEEGHDADSMYVRQTRRVGYGLAAAAMLPAIWVQVPSGLAVSGSLVSGIASADQIVGTGSNGTTVVNSTTVGTSSPLNGVAFDVGYSIIELAIGITVGLFLSAIVVYPLPLRKKRSGLFSF